MRTRRFPALHRDVAEVGLGCWQLGGTDWPDVGDARADAVLRQALDAGVTFFDTADIYGGGRSEERIGRFLRRTCPRGVTVATKLGRSSEPGWPRNFTLPVMRGHVEGSLRRLGVEVLDLVQLHCVPHEELRRGDVFEHLRTLRHEGKLLAFGASVESSDEASTCLEQDGLASLQVIFNVLRQEPLDRFFRRAQDRQVAVIVRLPLASGMLGGKLAASTTFAAGDHRAFNRDGQAFHVGETFAGFPFEVGLALVEELRGALGGGNTTARGPTLAQLALRWVLDHEAVTTVIPGASRPEQVAENAAASELPSLPPALHQRLAAFYRDRVQPHVRGGR
jgi:aryl-alcohol dehydrogenase-like predicted oxidoreductase